VDISARRIQRSTGCGDGIDARAMVDRLIGFPTVSRDSNPGRIESARDEPARLGVRSQLIYDVSKKKANLFATLASEPERMQTGRLVLSGYTDTVPVNGQHWTNDRLHGFAPSWPHPRSRHRRHEGPHLAIALAWAPRFLAAQERLPVHLSLSYDEQTAIFWVRAD
jgi:acetylornithine deacetylase